VIRRTIVISPNAVDTELFAPAAGRVAERRALGLEQDGKIVLVSGGGWGVGDLEGAVEASLRDSEVASVVLEDFGTCSSRENVNRQISHSGFRWRNKVGTFVPHAH